MAKKKLVIKEEQLNLDGPITYDYVFALVLSNMRKRGIPCKFIILSFDWVAEIAAKYQDKCDIWFKFSDKEKPKQALVRRKKSTKQFAKKKMPFISKLVSSWDMEYIRMAKNTVEKVWFFGIEHENDKTFIGAGYQWTYILDEQNPKYSEFKDQYEQLLKDLSEWKLKDMEVSEKAKKAKIITQYGEWATDEQVKAIEDHRAKIDKKKNKSKKI